MRAILLNHLAHSEATQAARRTETELRERLKREGLIDGNKNLPAPWDYYYVVVIAPEGAAGLGDFEAEANRLEAHGVCKFT